MKFSKVMWHTWQHNVKIKDLLAFDNGFQPQNKTCMSKTVFSLLEGLTH